MRLSTWRPGLLSWLAGKVVIHSYFLQHPEQPGQSSLFLPPLRDIQPYSTENDYHCTAVQDIYISTRYSQIPYYQLPINTIEGVYSTICLGLLRDYQSIADLLDVSIEPIENAITVEELPNGDWVVTIKIVVNLRFVIEPEDTTTDVVWIDRINLGLYRATLGDFQDKTLDWSYST